MPLDYRELISTISLLLFQKSNKGDPVALLKKQLEEKERSLQEGIENTGLPNSEHI